MEYALPLGMESQGYIKSSYDLPPQNPEQMNSRRIPATNLTATDRSKGGKIGSAKRWAHLLRCRECGRPATKAQREAMNKAKVAGVMPDMNL